MTLADDLDAFLASSTLLYADTSADRGPQKELDTVDTPDAHLKRASRAADVWNERPHPAHGDGDALHTCHCEMFNTFRSWSYDVPDRDPTLLGCAATESATLYALVVTAVLDFFAKEVVAAPQAFADDDAHLEAIAPTPDSTEHVDSMLRGSRHLSTFADRLLTGEEKLQITDVSAEADEAPPEADVRTPVDTMIDRLWSLLTEPTTARPMEEHLREFTAARLRYRSPAPNQSTAVAMADQTPTFDYVQRALKLRILTVRSTLQVADAFVTFCDLDLFGLTALVGAEVKRGSTSDRAIMEMSSYFDVRDRELRVHLPTCKEAIQVRNFVTSVHKLVDSRSAGVLSLEFGKIDAVASATEDPEIPGIASWDKLIYVASALLIAKTDGDEDAETGAPLRSTLTRDELDFIFRYVCESDIATINRVIDYLEVTVIPTLVDTMGDVSTVSCQLACMRRDDYQPVRTRDELLNLLLALSIAGRKAFDHQKSADVLEDLVKRFSQ